MIGGIWANSNYDNKEDTRSQILDSIDNWVQEAILKIYEVPEPEVDWESPFWKASQMSKE